MTNSENGLSIGREILAEALGGEQPVFDWLRYDNYDSPGLSFTRTARAKGAAAALEQFSKAVSSAAISEGTLNQVGYSLMGNKQTADAILILRKNVELHPDSWNAYDSLGEAYLKNGEKGLATKSYQKSVELNPKNENGVEALKKLRRGIKGDSDTRPPPGFRSCSYCNCFSIAAVISFESGVTAGSNRCTTFPFLSTRNFVKFHLMSPESPAPVCFVR